MRFALGRSIAAVSIVVFGVLLGGAVAADLAFQPAGEGTLSSTPASLRGKVQLDGKSQGIPR